MEKLFLYTDFNQYTKEKRPHLADILRPFINDRTYQQNRTVYGEVVDCFALVEDAKKAVFGVLPYAWNYYHQTKTQPEAARFINNLHALGKPVISWVAGDFGARVPVKDVWVFGAAGYKSRAGSRRFGTPVFIRDPLIEMGRTEIDSNTKQALPRIGFCGYARTSWSKALAFSLRTAFRNLAGELGLTGAEAQALIFPVWLRQSVLANLRSSLLVETDFIQNGHYKAGAHTQEEERTARQRFWENIRNTDYTVCVRGTGNFSVRLYETLAMGRIPILVDTDCLLPYADAPEWHTCCVYVRADEIHQIAQKVYDFHARLSDEAFAHVQQHARRFWVERLSLSGFFSHFHEHFPGYVK